MKGTFPGRAPAQTAQVNSKISKYKARLNGREELKKGSCMAELKLCATSLAAFEVGCSGLVNKKDSLYPYVEVPENCLVF